MGAPAGGATAGPRALVTIVLVPAAGVDEVRGAGAAGEAPASSSSSSNSSSRRAAVAAWAAAARWGRCTRPVTVPITAAARARLRPPIGAQAGAAADVAAGCEVESACVHAIGCPIEIILSPMLREAGGRQADFTAARAGARAASALPDRACTSRVRPSAEGKKEICKACPSRCKNKEPGEGRARADPRLSLSLAVSESGSISSSSARGGPLERTQGDHEQGWGHSGYGKDRH